MAGISVERAAKAQAWASPVSSVRVGARAPLFQIAKKLRGIHDGDAGVGDVVAVGAGGVRVDGGGDEGVQAMGESCKSSHSSLSNSVR